MGVCLDVASEREETGLWTRFLLIHNETAGESEATYKSSTLSVEHNDDFPFFLDILIGLLKPCQVGPLPDLLHPHSGLLQFFP